MLEAVGLDLDIGHCFVELFVVDVDEVGVSEDLLGVIRHQIPCQLKHLRIFRIHRKTYLELGHVLGLLSIHEVLRNGILEIIAFLVGYLLVLRCPGRASAEKRAVSGPVVFVDDVVVVLAL